MGNNLAKSLEGMSMITSRFRLDEDYSLEEAVDFDQNELRICLPSGNIISCGAESIELLPGLSIAIDIAMKRVLKSLLEKPDCDNDAELKDFFTLSKRSRDFLLSYTTSIQEAQLVDLVLFDDDAVWEVSGERSNMIISRRNLMRAIHLHEDQKFCDALATGKLIWSSIFGDYDIDARILFDSFDFGIIFLEEKGLRYYVGVGLANLRAFCVYIPAYGLCFGWNSGWHSLCFATMHSNPAWLYKGINNLLLNNSIAIIKWLSIRPTTTGQIMWPANETHLGHYIWNELTGLEKIVDAGCSSSIDVWQLSNKDETNFYGPLEWIFPEFTGRIRKESCSISHMNSILVASNSQAVRVSGERVTAEVRRRLRSANLRFPNSQCLTEIQTAYFPEFTKIVLGLRQGRRVLLNTVDVYREVITGLHQQIKNMFILIDGLNSAPGIDHNPFRIHFGSPSKDPLDEETKVADQIISICREKGIPCLSLVGSSMDFNLKMIMHAKFFVAPWGGGLAKYRWIANIPGYAIASSHNLSRPHILSIYHASEFMEDASPLFYPEKIWITDVEQRDEAGQSDVDFRASAFLAGDIISKAVNILRHDGLDHVCS